MRSAWCLLGLLLAISQPAIGQVRSTISDEPLSERRVSYDIVADLDEETRTITGIERITWRNPDRVPVDELQFHLYLNAFSGPNTTFMRESGGSHRGFSSTGMDHWGGVDVTALHLVDDVSLPHGDFSTLPSPLVNEPGVDLTDAIDYIRPDDGNPNDFTVMRVKLPEPVLPGETIALNVEFVSKLPEIVARTGWKRKEDGSLFVMAGQWFPKLGVYEVPGQRYVPADAERGRWNTHQFHENSEFYSDFGTYRVSIEVPDNYVVAATGVRLSETASDGRKTVVQVAEDVHDFAWTASPAFLEFTDVWEHVAVKLVIQPEHQDQVERHFAAAKVALRYFTDWYGEYPYTTLTLVDGIGGSNGMEYPTLITCGTTYGLPDWLRIPEIVIIHEFGHQYWYGLVASNEFEEAWLDEGINSYTEAKIMDAAYGPGSVLDIPGWRVSNEEVQRLMYTKNSPTRDRIFLPSWEYSGGGSFARNSYWKPATVLSALENYVGLETMRSLLRTYYQRWRFKHPTTRDFIDVANEVSATDLSWFFDQFIYGSVAVDYRVDTITNSPLGPDSVETRYDSRVVLHRVEEGVFPVDVLLRFEDGASEHLQWDGRDEWFTHATIGPARLMEAFIDPENKVTLEIDRSNNRKTIEPEDGIASKYGYKVIVWLQQLFQIFSALI